MKCAACGYDNEEASSKAKAAEKIFEGRILEEIKAHVKPFIERYIYMSDSPNGFIFIGRMYACPQCGTVRIEV